VAGLLLAVTGYFVAFGRILQYPSMALLLDALVMLCLFRFSRGDRAEQGYGVAGALLLVGATLMAFSAVFLLPVVAVAIWPRLAGPDRARWSALAAWCWPLVLVLPGLTLFYVLLPHAVGGGLNLETTFSTYLSYRLGSNRPYFNLEPLLLSLAHYNSSPYVLVVLGGGLLVVLKPLQEELTGFFQPRGSERLHPGSALSLAALDLRNLSLATAFLGITALLLSTARRALGWKMAFVWFAGPLATHLFLVRLVGTHWRESLPGLVLLLGAAASGCFARFAGPRLRLMSLLAGAVLLLGVSHYVYVIWVQRWPEYLLTYPRFRHPLDWTNLGVWRGGSILGATRDHGWKTVYVLMSRGELPDEYGSSDRAEAAWYLKRTRVCAEDAPLYIRLPNSAREREAVERGDTLPGFFLAGRVYVDGHAAMALLLREPPPGGPKAYRDEDYSWQYDRDFSSPWTPVGDLYRPLVNEEARCGTAG
jgi:hypothetical protein